MTELQYKVVLDSDSSDRLSESVGFGSFIPADDLSVVYGEEEVLRFYNDLILGRPLPLTFVARGLNNLGTFLAISLFLQRDLVLHPQISSIVSAVTLFDTYGVAGAAHIDRDLSRVLKGLKRVLASPPNGSEDQNQILGFALNLLRDYVEKGKLPPLPPEKDPPVILDRGTNGFVVANQEGLNLSDGWEELYRLGYLRGVLTCPLHGTERWGVLGARKSTFVDLDLVKAASALNDAETAAEGTPEWVSDGLWLVGPTQGTVLLPSMVLRILLVC